MANIGGYIGLFLGYAILQIPTGIGSIMNSVKGLITRRISFSPEGQPTIPNTITLDTNPSLSFSTSSNDEFRNIKQSLKDVKYTVACIERYLRKIDPEFDNVI